MARTSLVVALWRQNRIIALLLLALLLGNVSLYAWTVRVVRPEKEQLTQSLERQQQELEQMRRLGARQDTPEAVYRQGRRDLVDFYAMIPPRDDLTSLIEELFVMARDAGLDIDRISYDPQQLEERALLSYSLMFSVTGSYDQLKRFVHALEGSTRLISLDEIALSGSETTGNGVSLNMRFTTYYQAGPA